ncbi:MAG: hypothetical protein ABIM99_04310 [Candidatus Dojkabacteria bacterium]
MKKVVIAVVVLLLLCCCCTVIGAVLLFTSPSGYVEFNGQCLHRGEQSNPKSGPCVAAPLEGQTPSTTPNPAPTPTTNGSTTIYSGRNSDEYVFAYSKKFFLDDGESDITHVYAKDPKDNQVGDFNDNLNITTASDALNVTQDNCDYYSEQLLASIGTSLNIDQTSVATDIQTINGLKVCVVSWEGSITGIDFTQQQYVFSDSVLDKNFIVTVSTAADSTNVGAFANIVDSFETK